MHVFRSNVSLLVTLVLSTVGCIPREAIIEQTERLERAKTKSEYSTLVEMCLKPKEYRVSGGRGSSCCFAPIKDVTEQACVEAKALLLRRQQERLTTAVQKQDGATLQAMCRTVETFEGSTPEQLGLIPVQQQACVEFEKQTAAELTQVTTEAKALGGLQCLVKLDGYFFQLKKSAKWLSADKTDEGNRAALQPTTEACLAEVEAAAQAGKHVELYKQTTTLKLSTTGCLNSAQAQRLGVVVTSLPPAIASLYEAEAAKLSAEPAAAALYLASAARLAQVARDDARRQKNLTNAKALVAKAGIKEVLTVSFSGDGLAAEVITRLKTGGLGAGLAVAEGAGDLSLSLELTAPEFSSDSEKIVLHTEVKEQRGTKIRHEWAEKKKDCDRAQGRVDHALDNCRRNGPRDSWCLGLASNQRDVKWCHERLQTIKKEEPAFVTSDVPYEGTKYVGALSGTLTIKQGSDAPKKQPVRASDERVGHGFVERAKLSPVNVKPPTAGELKSAYFSSATSTVYNLLRAQADARASTFLDSAQKATTTQAMAADLVRFAVIAKKRPDGKLGQAFDEKLSLPAMDALSLLLSEK